MMKLKTTSRFMSLLFPMLLALGGIVQTSTAREPVDVVSGAEEDAVFPVNANTERRTIVASDGAEFLLSVTPPEGRRVDPRIFSHFEITASGGDDDRFSSGGKHSPVTVIDAPVDITGYAVQIEMTAPASASCSSYITRASNVSLSVGGVTYVYPSSYTPEYMASSAYPKSGDVDVYIYSGSTSTICSSSTYGSGYLDSAGCRNSGCATTTQMFTGFKQYGSSTTKFDYAVQYMNITL